ncbi:protein kinase domain-containing protein [Hyalangium rubrum]|uniref:Protein kinase n=1 Tax=Hyalangium rubrum TaxID=3103134 RepID=A0ABU5H138_9BACT|nr:protein kinase [Hyalangium sp. s54d21]MDY7225820.1 protein kinase [Hyalangium sp. s54d21]
MATYRLVRKLAAGGMAEVFLAKVVGAEGFEKPVAVKRILPSLVQDQEFVELFLREAKLTVSLQHANVVQVFDLGCSRGQYYMVMEFVDGENLRALQRAAAAQQVPMGLREVCFIVQQVAEGLAYAHEKLDSAGRPLNIIHRDINPSNVMVAVSGEVKLADFGIAKAANVQSGTQVGVVKGKVGYLAPEQVRGGAVDQRADLFLLGLLLYELLSGQQLFSGPDYFQILRSISTFDVKTVVPVPGVPAPLWSIVARALAPDPVARFQRARDVSDALQNFLFDHRLRVGPQDVARLFARCFPERGSSLEGGAPVESRGEEIRLGAEGASPPAGSHALPMRSPTRTELPRPVPQMQTPPQMSGTREHVAASAVVGTKTVAIRTNTRPELQRPAVSSSLNMATGVEPGRRLTPVPLPQQPAVEVSRRISLPTRSNSAGTHPALPTRVNTGVTHSVLPPRSSSASSQIAQLAALRPRPSVRRRLGELLLLAGKISEAQLLGMLERQRREGGKLGERLVAEGIVSDEDVVSAISEQLGLPFIAEHQLRTLPVPTPLLSLLPLEHAERFEAVPLTLQGKELICAMREPQNLERLDELQFRTGYAVRGILASEGAIRRTIGRFYRGEEAPVGPEWNNLMKVSPSEVQQGVTPFADKHTRTRERVLDEEAFTASHSQAEPQTATQLVPQPAPQPVAQPAPQAPAPAPMPTRAPPRSLARTLLVVADDAEQRDAAVRLFSRQGVAAAGSSSAEAERAVALGGIEVALIAGDTMTDTPALVARLMTAAPTMEVRVLPSLAEALGGEAGPLGRAARLHARVLDAALAALGGAGVQGAALAKLARRVAIRLGAGRAEAERASAAAYATACAARLEGKERFARPSCEAVRAVLGRDAGELASLVGVCAEDNTPAANAGRGTLALTAATALMEVLGTDSPTPDAASRALVKLREEGRVPPNALEALAAEVAELVLGDSASNTVVLAEPDPARSATLQARFLADGVRVLLADSAARARQLLAQGAHALVMAANLPDSQGAALTVSLRGEATTAELPIFVLAPPEDPGLVEAGLDAGADDVLTYPVNPDVLAAKVRRALQPRRSLAVAAS